MRTAKSLTAKCPYGEVSLLRSILTANCPYGEVSVQQSVRTAKCPYSEMSTSEMSYGEMSYGEKSYGENSGHGHKAITFIISLVCEVYFLSYNSQFLGEIRYFLSDFFLICMVRA